MAARGTSCFTLQPPRRELHSPPQRCVCWTAASNCEPKKAFSHSLVRPLVSSHCRSHWHLWRGSALLHIEPDYHTLLVLGQSLGFSSFLGSFWFSFPHNAFLQNLGVSQNALGLHSLPRLPRSTPTLVNPPKKRRKQKTQNRTKGSKIKQLQFVPPIHSLEHGQTSSRQSLRENCTLLQSHPPSRNHQLQRATLQDPYRNFEEFSSMPSCLGWVFLERGGWGQHRSRLCLSFSTISLQSSTPLQKKLPCPSQSAAARIITSTWFLVTVWTTDIYMASRVNTNHGPQRGL